MVIKTIDCPYCGLYALRQPKNDKEQEQIRQLLTEHCEKNHISDVIWDIVKDKISNFKLSS